MSDRYLRRLPLTVVVLLVCSETIAARQAEKFEVSPGPAVMSEAEKAIRADPAAGIEHAVILLEETYRNEDIGRDMETRYHARIKILSNEARGLADVEIPFYAKDGVLKRWWGRTILPDGTVLEFPRDQLEEQSLVRIKGAEAKLFKAALPGVVAGCVIDYGFRLVEKGYHPYARVDLQRRHLIREFRFRWQPSTLVAETLYALSGTKGLAVEAKAVQRGVYVTGRNLPPVREEAFMPPEHEVRAALIMYYLPRGTDSVRFWEHMARDISRLPTGKKRSIQRILDEMNLPASASVDDRLRAAYEWLGSNISRTDLRTFEETETVPEDEEKNRRDLVADLLDSREGSAGQINRTYLGVARALGAEASLVFVADRTKNFFSSGLLTMGQFETTLVAVRPEGTPEEATVLLDPCSGLPYGEIPWWIAGAQGMMMAKTGPRVVQLPPTNVRHNISQSRVELSFSEGNETMVGKWTRTLKGQVGLSERRHLRRLEPEERSERVERLCGAAAETDILAAKVSGLGDVAMDLVLECETESWDTGSDEVGGHYRFDWSGPWLRATPKLPDKPRVHPVVFDYPRVDSLTLEIEAPEGFVPLELPSPVKVETSLGRYILRFSHTTGGVKVERALALLPLTVPPREYGALRSFVEEVRRADRTPLMFAGEDRQQ